MFCFSAAVGCDATNALVWQNTKLHNLRVCSFYPLDDFSEPDWGTFARSVETLNMIADIKPLSDGTNAELLHGVILDQLEGIGCPTWRSTDLVKAPNHLHIYVFNTDAGGDISKCKRNIIAEIEGLEHVAVFHVDCLMHQYHLAVRSELNAMDYLAEHHFELKPGYWRRLCTQL